MSIGAAEGITLLLMAIWGAVIVAAAQWIMSRRESDDDWPNGAGAA